MKVKHLLFAMLAAAAISCSPADKAKEYNSNYMWFDCEANYERLSNPDSIYFYMKKTKEAGFDNVVVDVKSIMGEVLYDSHIAPYMGEWEGHYRRQDYDMLGYFIKYGKELDMQVFGSLNIFAGGHNFFDRGIIYKQHPEWQSIVYDRGKLTPISEMKHHYNGMMNPANPEVQEYQLSILKEFAELYPEVDGIIFDRVRFDGITSDFSPLSKQLFEEYAGVTVENYPDDVLYWEKNSKDELVWRRGPHFNKWVEWRAMTIHNFVEKAHTMLKEVNPDLIIGDYTGAWYPTYYQLGVNWASKDYDPSERYDWATENYKNTGYAEMLDVYMTGLYYTLVSKEDVDNANGFTGVRNEAGMDVNDLTYCYSVEGGAELAKGLTGRPVIGSIYVEQYMNDFSVFGPAVTQALKSSDGLMIFDIVHLIKHSLWDELADAMAAAQEQIEAQAE